MSFITTWATNYHLRSPERKIKTKPDSFLCRDYFTLYEYVIINTIQHAIEVFIFKMNIEYALDR